MPQHQALQVRLAKRWGLQPRLSKFLVLLLTMDCVSEHTVQERIGNVAGAVLAHHLRRALKWSGFPITIRPMRGYGYWISDEDKRRIAALPELRVVVEDAATEINRRALEYVNTPDETDAEIGGSGT